MQNFCSERYPNIRQDILQSHSLMMFGMFLSTGRPRHGNRGVSACDKASFARRTAGGGGPPMGDWYFRTETMPR